MYESSDDVPRQVATVQGEKGLKKPRENAEPQSEVIELSGSGAKMASPLNVQTPRTAGRGLICLTLGLITLAVFAPALQHEFLAYDDGQYVTENPHVVGGLSWQGVNWAFRAFYASNWHPLTWLSHMVDCQLYHLRPAGHHLTSVLLHVGNSVLLFLVLCRMTGTTWRSAFVAALFAWHPMHVESVAWVAERKDVLSAFFFLLTIGAYVKYAESKVSGAILHPPSPIFYLLALLCFAFGLLSKPMVVTLPFVLLLLDYWPLGRFQPRTRAQSINPISQQSSDPPLHNSTTPTLRLILEKLPFFAFTAAGCLLTISAQRRAYSIVSTAALPADQRIFHALSSYLHYLSATFVPRRLAVYYPYETAITRAEIAVGSAVLLFLTLLALWSASRRAYLFTGWAWFLGMLVPVIGFVQVGDQARADRYTYLPLIGLFIAIVWGGSELVERAVRNAKMRRILAGSLAAAVGGGLVGATSLQLRYWKNTRILFEHAARVTRENGRALVLLGSLLAEEGKSAQAMEYYHRALAYKSDSPQAHFSIAKLLEKQGKLDQAVAEYKQALWFKPLREETHIRIGRILARQKNYDEAAANYKVALALNPESAPALNNLARLLHTEGKQDEAIETYSRALKFDPRLAEAHNNLGVLLLQKGRVNEGVAELRKALNLKPGDAETQYNLALGLNQQQQWKEASQFFAKIAPGKPQDANLYCEFGLALTHLGRTREAMSRYAHALLVQPDLPAALDRLSWILATNPDPQLRNGTEALRMAERACELTERKDAEMLRTLAAAYAEAGRFPQAIDTAQQARDLAASVRRKDLAAECHGMLEMFKAAKPWRQDKLADGNPTPGSSSSK